MRFLNYHSPPPESWLLQRSRPSITALGMGLVWLLACAQAETPEEARATSVATVGPSAPWLRNLSISADVIAAGKVRLVEAFPVGPMGEPGIHSRVTMALYRTLKGRTERELLFWMPGGVLPDRARQVSHQMSFERGEEVVVFLSVREDGEFFLAQLATGKWLLRRTASEWWLQVPAARIPTPRGVDFLSFKDLLGVLAAEGTRQ